jgi:MFS family permease
VYVNKIFVNPNKPVKMHMFYKSHLKEFDEIEALLPWYVTGRLSPAQSARVARYLETHPEAATHVQLAQEELVETIAANEMLGVPTARVFGSLLASVFADRMGIRRSVISKWVEQLGIWLNSLAPSQLNAVAIAAAFVLLLQAISIGVLVVENPTGNSYQTASAPQAESTATGTFAIVAFVPDATARDLGAFLNDIGAEIVDGPKGGSLYRVRLSNERLRPQAIDAAVQKLMQKDSLIAFAAPLE